MGKTLSTTPDITGPADAACSVRRVSLEDLDTIWKDSDNGLDWRCLFTLPPWLTSWWSIFGNGKEPHVVLAQDRNGLLGLAPLKIRGPKATIIGSPDVCDYLDLIAVPRRRSDFVRAFFEYLAKDGIKQLSLSGVREGAVVWTDVIQYARTRGWQIKWEKEDVAFAIQLPRTWEAFLYQLNGKQRHELRRKLRRLHEAGEVGFRLVYSAAEVSDTFDRFIELFRASRVDKAAFMTKQMAGFFRSLASAFSKHQILKLGILELSAKPVSMVMCFDYRSTRYLYNSGYDPRFRALGVGLMAKILSIRDAVEKGLIRYDFLKGAEDYKQRLGGESTQLYRCTIHVA